MRTQRAATDGMKWILSFGALCGSLMPLGCGQAHDGSASSVPAMDECIVNLSSYVQNEVWLLRQFAGAAFHARLSGTIVENRVSYRVVSFVAFPAVGISQAVRVRPTHLVRPRAA